MKSDLTVLSVVENDCGILDLMIRSIYKFTNPAPKIILCNNGKTDLGKYMEDTNIVVVDNNPDLKGGSNRHGDALNKISRMVTTERTAIIESDCIVLCDGWDITNSKVLAAKKAEKNGKILYHVCFMIFDTELLKNVDFRPGTDKTRSSNKSYGLWEDVGWRIRNKVSPKDVEFLTFVDCKSGKGKHFGSQFQSDEFWLGDRAIVAHFGRGSNISGKAIRKNFKHPTEQLKEWKKIAEGRIK
jgi:hypothetical protein